MQNNCLEKSPKIILGIDPGTLLMGYCIIHVEGSVLRMVEMNVLKLKTSQDNYERLQVIYKKIQDVILCGRRWCYINYGALDKSRLIVAYRI